MTDIFKITKSHAVDILGNVIGRDQQIMTITKACNLVSLLDKNDFLNDKVVFFDPFCKAGELLLASAFYSCWFKCIQNKHEFRIDHVNKELYESKRYFGLAPDERHYRLSLRTFLGNTHSHDDKYNQIIRDGRYLSEVDGRLNLDKFNMEFNSMIEYIRENSKVKKIIAIGNPPYQESDGGFGKSAKSIYDLFVQSLIESKDIEEFLFVIPARWFGAGKGLDAFREQMMSSNKIKNLVYFKNSAEVFPTVDINGGICFLHYSKNHDGDTKFSDGSYQEDLKLNEFDIIADDPKGYKIIRKVLNKWKDKYIGSIAWSRKPFGLATDFFNKNKEISNNNKDAIPCLTRNKIIKYLDRKLVTKNVEHIDRWKVSVPAVAGGSKGNRRSTIPIEQIFLIPKGTITTETYSIIDSFETKDQAENLITYLKTDFARYLLGLRKITQHIPKDRWNWVPYVDINKRWADKSLAELFNLSEDEIQHIKMKVEEWS
jgi:hypothetical protein